MSPRCAWCDADIDHEQSMSDLCADCNAVELQHIEDEEKRARLRSIAEDQRVDEYIDRRRGVL